MPYQTRQICVQRAFEVKKMYAQVAVELPVDGVFTYSVPAIFQRDARLGMRVLVSFNRRTVTGYITGFVERPEVKDVKDIIDLLDDRPIFDSKRLEFYRWMSSYYFAPLGEVLSLIHPSEASVKSYRFFTATAEGIAACPSLDGLKKDILDAAHSGVSLAALLKRFKNRPVYGTVEWLKKKDFLAEELRIKGGAGPRTELWAELTPHGRALTPQSGTKETIGIKVHRYLLENGAATLAELKRKFGSVQHAVKKLQASGVVGVAGREARKDPLSEITPKTSLHEPNAEQKKAIKEISSTLKKGAQQSYSPYLLYWVTGSGKTLVYLSVIEEAVKAGKKAIFLVPEISLVRWPAAYLKEMFPGRVAVAHSALSPAERLDEWRRIARGEADIVVGARSALFSPLSDLGLIVVDEEHETSYKQEEGVRYHGRDASLMLGKHLGITVVLGSATPSIETFYNATVAAKLKCLYLKGRIEGTALPTIEITDVRGKKGAAISDRLRGLLGDTLCGGHQALLFLNRRGFSGSLICADCGHTWKCLNCSVSLTLHKRDAALKCHYCDMVCPVPAQCPSCNGCNLRDPGVGTERVEEEIKKDFPGARTIRMDRDTTAAKGSAKSIIDAFEGKKTDVLIGTQMVSKGHHFPGITLVGIVSGDTSLNIPDFRSSERTFQLVTQAAGRAGRGDVLGHVVIQTRSVEHYSLKCAVTHDYGGFFTTEIETRGETMYPPFARLCAMRIDALGEARGSEGAQYLKKAAYAAVKKYGYDVVLLGPAPALVYKLRGRFRWQMLIKGADVKAVHGAASAIKSAFSAKKHPGVELIIDMDPLTIC